MVKGTPSFFSQIESVGPARYLIYLGFILVPLSNTISVVEWHRDPFASMTVTRPDYPVGTSLLLTGLILIFSGPWFASGSFVRRLAVFGITMGVFLFYMIPMAVLFIATGVPLQD
ncbi:MAG: hypothetical protein R3F11_09620 [Verrucomicrobiales bacterium]